MGDICGSEKGPQPAVWVGEGLVGAVLGDLWVLEILLLEAPLPAQQT